MNPDLNSNQSQTAPAPAIMPAPGVGADSAARVPGTWPGGFKVYKYSKEAVRTNIGTLVLLVLLSYVVSIPLQLYIKNIGSLLSIIPSGLFTAATTYVYILGVRGQKTGVKAALNKGLSVWLKMIGVSILTTVITGLSLLLLIIPFFFVFPRLLLAPYYLVDQDLGVVEALKVSWAASKGNVGKVYGILGASFAMALLIFTIIGIPVAVYLLIMYSAVFAVLYEFITTSQQSPHSLAPAQTPSTTQGVTPVQIQPSVQPISAPVDPAQPMAQAETPSVISPQPVIVDQQTTIISPTPVDPISQPPSDTPPTA